VRLLITSSRMPFAPSDDPEAFAANVERIAAENEIDLVLPMFEEVFELAGTG
jgi:hypothetical protein